MHSARRNAVRTELREEALKAAAEEEEALRLHASKLHALAVDAHDMRGLRKQLALLKAEHDKFQLQTIDLTAQLHECRQALTSSERGRSAEKTYLQVQAGQIAADCDAVCDDRAATASRLKRAEHRCMLLEEESVARLGASRLRVKELTRENTVLREKSARAETLYPRMLLARRDEIHGQRDTIAGMQARLEVHDTRVAELENVIDRKVRRDGWRDAPCVVLVVCVCMCVCVCVCLGPGRCCCRKKLISNSV